MKNQFFLLLFISIATLANAVNPPAKGHKYSPAEGKFSIVFPATFTTESTEVSGATTIKTSAQVGDQTFFVGYTVHNVSLEGQGDLAAVSLESFVEAVTGKITQQGEWKVKGGKGIKANVTIEEKDARIQYHVVLVGQIQYQVVYVAPNAAWNQKAVDAFVKSFKISK